MTTQNASIGSSLRLGACVIAATLVVALVAPRQAAAQADGRAAAAVEDGLYSCGKARGKVSVSFKPEVELKDLITWAMGFTCKNFLYSSGIGGRTAKVTIIAPQKMSAQQAWQVFLVALQTMNLTVVPQGNVLRVIETAQAKGEPLPLYRKGEPGDVSQLVRMVIRPQHVPVDEVANALNAVKSKDGLVTPLPRMGIVVVTDYGSAITKMSSLMREVDQPTTGENLYSIPVEHADATELAGKLQEILGISGGPPGGAPGAAPRSRGRQDGVEMGMEKSDGEVASAVPSKIIAEERTNTLIVLASEPAYLRVRSLIKLLDTPVGQGTGRIHVYYLDNAESEELATTLTAVISGASQPQAGRGGGPQPPRRGGQPPQQQQTISASDMPAFEGQVRITHDKPTNALVIVASRNDFMALRDVIRKLDIPRMQVFIEAVILEVTADNGLDFGTSFHGGTALDSGTLLLGGLQHKNLQSISPASLATASGLLGGALGPLLPGSAELLGTSIPSLGILFQALATRGNINVLSSPHILTMSNREAEISVGENIPYQSGFVNLPIPGGGIPSFPVQSVQRQDVALTLKITPQINASDMVRLEIDQEISDIASPNFAGLGPSWAKRTVKTTVVVRDQQSIVIGGLVSDRETYSESKIPLLGDVPILGYLFKYSTKSKRKANLLILLTPHVIKDQLDIEHIVQRKVRERAEFMRAFSTFTTLGYDPKIDYGRKRGLIEEINRTVLAVERDAEILREDSMHRRKLPEGRIEYSAPGDDAAGDEPDQDGAMDPTVKPPDGDEGN